MSKVHDVFVKQVFHFTEGLFQYASPDSLNSLAWYGGKVSDEVVNPDLITAGWGLARLPVAKPGLHVGMKRYVAETGDKESRYDTFPKQDNNAVSENGAVYTRYSFIQTQKVFDWDRKFPTEAKAKKTLTEFIKVLSEGIPIETGDNSCIKNGVLYLQNPDGFESIWTYFQHTIYWIALYREGGAEQKFHIKRITADMTAALALASVGVQATPPDDRYLAQLRNVFFAFPKKLTYAAYNAERYLRKLEIAV